MAQALLGFIRDLSTMTGDKKCIHFTSPVAAEQALESRPCSRPSCHSQRPQWWMTTLI